MIAGIWILFYGVLYIPAFISGAPAEKRSRRFGGHMVLIVIIAFLLIVLMARYGSPLLLTRIVPDTLPAGIAGVALTATGLGFSAWARIHLGRLWSSMVSIRQGHRIIRTGPYRFVRNPMYLGLIIAFAGAALAIGEVIAFVAVGLGTAAVLVKIHDEEEILQETFGDEYLLYKKQVKSLIPYIL